MRLDRIRVLIANLRQRFDPKEADELHAALGEAEPELAALQALRPLTPPAAEVAAAAPDEPHRQRGRQSP